MPTVYMLFWSLVVVMALGIWRLRTWGQMLVVLLITALVLLISQSLFVQLALTAQLDPAVALTQPALFVWSGPIGWLALLVMPCGWLGPILGLHLVQRWQLAPETE